ncbi:MAG: PHP domain-containing protein [Clostridia bacterium]|nr:PHP domain-containing protein [Clostridia bacterium]
MKLTSDYHTHTPYSHGKNTVLENAKAAKNAGLKEVGITDHGFNHLLFGLKRNNLSDLRAEIVEAEKLTGVKVLLGMESNLISVDGETDMKESDLQYFDLYLCGIHEVLKYKSFSDMRNIMLKNYTAYKFGRTPSESVVKTTTKAYINAIKNNPIDILTHINYKCYCNLEEVAKCCADYGTYIELNTKKRHISPDELNLMAKTGVKFVIDSDAHSADRVGDIKIAQELLSEADIPLELIENIDGRLPNFRFKEYKAKHI